MPPTILDPFDHSYEDQPVNDLIVSIRFAAEKQKVHSAFQGELPEYVTRPDKLTELSHELEAVRDAAIGRAPDMVAQQDALMAKAVKALRFNSHHVVMVSQHRNDSSVLNEAGYQMKQRCAARVKINLLDLVPGISVKHGPGAEAVTVIIKRAKSNASIELQMTENPNDEQSWKRTGEGTYSRCRIELRGLEPTKRLYFRARYHVDGAAGHWCAPVSIIVI
jgi:hypothetical protein